MDEKKRNEILNKMVEISGKVDFNLDEATQERGKISYFEKFEFQKSGFSEENVYIVEIGEEKEQEVGDKTEIIKETIYQIYDENGELIANVSADGKIQFAPEYIDKIRNEYGEYFKQLKLDDIYFEFPEELGKNDIVMTKEEIEEYALSTTIDGRLKDEEKDKEENNKDIEVESEEEKKKRTAEALGIDRKDIRSISTINPNEKITDKYNLIDVMPEASKYKEVSIVLSNPNDKSYGQFSVIGVKENGTREKMNSIEPIEGIGTNKKVISINEDGSEVSDKQVKGLFRINSRNRDDGISVSIGDYGMMDIDYVSNVMDKEHRRSTPIKTKDSENRRIPTAKVRENAGDSKEEVKMEGRIYRAKQKAGIDPQSIDGIDQDRADGQSMTLEELKSEIKEKALEEGDMSRRELQEFIEEEISKSGFELTDVEIEKTAEEIEEQVRDESNFPTRGNRI